MTLGDYQLPLLQAQMKNRVAYKKMRKPTELEGALYWDQA